MTFKPTSTLHLGPWQEIIGITVLASAIICFFLTLVGGIFWAAGYSPILCAAGGAGMVLSIFAFISLCVLTGEL